MLAYVNIAITIIAIVIIIIVIINPVLTTYQALC